MTLSFQKSAEWAKSYRAVAEITDSGENDPPLREAMLISSVEGQIFGDEVMWMDEEGDTHDATLSEWCNELPGGRSFDVLGLDWWGIIVYHTTHPDFGPVTVVQTYMHSHGGANRRTRIAGRYSGTLARRHPDLLPYTIFEG